MDERAPGVIGTVLANRSAHTRTAPPGPPLSTSDACGPADRREPELFEHTARGIVPFERAGKYLLQLSFFECKPEKPPGARGGVAPVPVRLANPEANIAGVVPHVHQSGDADAREGAFTFLASDC